MRHTVFTPHRGDDGNLIADSGHSIPLDIYTPDAIAGWRGAPPAMANHVGIVVVDPENIDDVHAAVTTWCRDNIGREDIQFTN
ncbi:hypothetical protein AB0383_20400 [Amycolatopsis sp. NPDC051373]|uniref:hypothetical protein n=1 Tax=Amycolatopsis sp. NPDC051373 TaxID=3155801 RepID=UPI0034501B34